MNLHARDEVGNGGSGVLVTKAGEVEVARTRSARRWHLGGRRYRVGCAIGPVHYCADPFDPPGLAATDAWAPIDLRHTLSARAGVSRTMSACGYATDLATDYTVTVRRGGCDVQLAPVALEWRNAAGQVQLVAEPTPGLPVTVDEDGLWVLDAFGPGLDWGLRLWPDMARPVVRIADPASLFAGFRAPTIGATGLRLCKVLSVGWRNGQPDRDKLFSQTKPNRTAGKRRRTGAPDERVLNPGALAVRSGSHDALWFHEPRAWDDENGYALSADWQRHGQEVTVALGLDAASVAKATGALVIDTAIAEQQVGASTDDAHAYGTPWPANIGVSLNGTGVAMSAGMYSFACAGFRFADLPVPAAATITAMAVAVLAESSYTNSPTMRLYCEDADDSATFSSGSGPAVRTWTALYTLWAPPSWSSGSWYSTADFAAQGQIVVSRVGYAINNALTVIVPNHSETLPPSNQTRIVRSYDFGAASAAKLNAEYTEGGGGSPVWYYDRMRRR